MRNRAWFLQASLALAGMLVAPAFAETAPAPVPVTSAACPSAPTPDSAARNAEALRQLFAEDAANENETDPLAALYRGEVQEPAAIERIFTDALDRQRMQSARNARRNLSEIDRCALPADGRLSYDIFARLKDEQIAWAQPEVRRLVAVRPFNHFQGVHMDFAALVGPGGALAHRNIADYRRTLALYGAFPQVLDNAILRFREGMANGAVEPRLTVINMIAQIDALLAQPLERLPFMVPVSTFPAAVPTSQREILRGQFRQSATRQLIPAYRRLRGFLADEYLPAARESIGLSQMEGGARLYRMAIEKETTLPLEPEAVHQLGLSEVARIQSEMEQVKHELGFTGTLSAFFDHARTDPRFHPTSASQLSSGFREIAARVDRAVPRYFSRLPKASLVMAPYPAFRARFAAGGSYSEGDVTLGQPGMFHYNTYDLPHRFLSGMTTLYLHEAIPGHHSQISLARENEALPAFQRFGDNNAFVEGWALYAETLGYDMGLYEDPLQHWGTLDDEMLRAMRLVVDTGIHAKGWSREQAVNYMLANSGMGRSDAEAEVDRYVALPAQALSYKIGALTIQRLRDKARAALGARFDIRAFHEQVLGAGSLPLVLLENRIDAWIARERETPPGS